MNIIKYDTYFSPVITMDSTEITMDSTEFTMDNTTTEVYGYRLEILPRKYDENITLKVHEPFENSYSTYTPNYVVDNGLMQIELEFTPIENVVYNVNILNEEQEILWYGQCMYTTKDIQNYQLNNSDGNYLRF